MRAIRRFSAFLAAGLLVATALPGGAATNDWIALTVARNGAWGVASDPVQLQAIVGALRACRTKSPRTADCGSLLTTRRAGWIIAERCGFLNVLASGATRREAEYAASWRETDLRIHYQRTLPHCVRLITVDPRGTVVDGSLALSEGE
jgi:hypothetical protein